MADMGAIMALQKAERLVSTAARAFYTDISVLVVDTLIREKYIKDKDEDLGSRLNLQPKQVRSALADLMQEGLVMQEEMEDETYSSRLSAYWYIDLRHAVNVIRFRVHEMKLLLDKRRQAREVQQTYFCPRCGEKFGVMEIHRLCNGDHSFCCSHCCPNDDHADCVRSEYTLEEFVDKRGLASVNALFELMEEQMSKSTDPLVPRQSIFELSSALRDTVVPSNLPSDLRKRGMGGQHRGDVSSSYARFQDDFHHRGRAAEKAATERAAGGRRPSAKPVQVLYTKNWRGQEVVVELEQSEEEEEDDGDGDGWGAESDDEDGGGGDVAGGAGILPSRSDLKKRAAAAAAKEQQAAKRAKKVLPTFLKGSRISGEGVGGEDAEDLEDSEAESENSDDDPAGGAAAGDAKGAAAHVRRLGAAAVNSVEERDEFKRKLVPWTERMKQVWRKQQQQLRAEAAANAAESDEWWREDDSDQERVKKERRSQGGGFRNGGGGWVNGGGPSMARFFIRGRSVPIEALTKEEAAEISPEDYKRFYDLVTRER